MAGELYVEDIIVQFEDDTEEIDVTLSEETEDCVIKMYPEGDHGEITERVEAIEETLPTKADASDVEALEQTVATAEDEITSLKEDLNDDLTISNFASVTANTYKYVIINRTLTAGQRVKLYMSESPALQESDVYLVSFGSDEELFKVAKTYDAVEYTLTKDCTFLDVYIPSQLIIADGTATLNAVIYSVNRRLADAETDISDIDVDITGIGNDISGHTLSHNISVTTGVQSVYDFNGTFKKGKRLKLSLTGDSGILNSYETTYFIDPNYALTWPAYIYNSEPVEITLPVNLSKIRVVIGSTRIVSAGTVTATIEVCGYDYRISNNEEKLSTNTDNISKLIAATPNVELVPNSYYFGSYTDANGTNHNNYIDWKIGRINTLAKAAVGNGDAFIFITDEHWSQNAKQSLNLLNYIAQKTHIRNIISGGDTGEGGGDDFCKGVLSAWGNHPNTVHHVTGNHEYYSGGNNSNLYYMMDMQNNDEVGNPQEHYYYYDNVQAKIRYIILNSDGTSAWGDTQLVWFTSALNVESGWGIIIFVHWMYMVAWSTDAVSLGSSAPQGFVDTINNYSGNGEIIAVFQGHVHRDRITFTQTNGTPVIITTSDKYVRSESGGVYDIDVTRELGTITEQAFDVVIVNRGTKTINAVRIGGLARNGIGNDPGDEVEERTVTWN